MCAAVLCDTGAEENWWGPQALGKATNVRGMAREGAQGTGGAGKS